MIARPAVQELLKNFVFAELYTDRKDPVHGKSFGMDGDFGGSDFSSPTDSTAVPGTINKSVPLSGATEPVVMLYSDPALGAILPGTSPVGILALTSAMAGAGMWVMVRRRRMA